MAVSTAALRTRWKMTKTTMTTTVNNKRVPEVVGNGRNVVVLRGVLSRDSVTRTLPSGDELMSYEVTTRDGGGASTVPVSAGANSPVLVAGAEVVVVGQVKRRYFRAGGATQSRTEVVADTVIPARSAAKVAKAIERAVRLLET
jgi:single-strand DNA-binding protein